MRLINTLNTPTLITAQETIFHAAVEHTLDPRTLTQNIIIAEERFIKPAICEAFYEELIAQKNTVIDSGNIVAIQATMPNVIISIGQYLSDTAGFSANNVLLWNKLLWKLCAEAVYHVSIAANSTRFTSQGMMRNNPKSIIADSKISEAVETDDIKFLIDNSLQDRIQPLIAAIHNFLCTNKDKYPKYCKPCECDENGTISVNRKTPIIFGTYTTTNPCNKCQ